MRRALPFLACLLLAACQAGSDPSAPAAATTPDAAATPVQQVTASMKAFQEARSFHAEMSLEGARETRNALDFVAPDRYRMQMPIGTQVIIGDVLYLQSQGRTQKTQLPEGTVAQWRDPMQLKAGHANLDVQAQGSSQIDGITARQFLVRNGPSDQQVQFFYWIGPDGMPVQLRHQGVSQGQPYTMTVRYSRFNDPSIIIETPAASG
jgi:lipoprotein-anchoring transpeptidase ErfK/SrfK